MTDTTTTGAAELVRCTFYLRTPAEDGGYRYTLMSPDRPSPAPWPTRWRPHTGDLIDLPGLPDNPYLVLATCTRYPAPGSRHWPHGFPAPVMGPHMDVVVVPDAGLFADEVQG